jgi:hypothetical protein
LPEGVRGEGMVGTIDRRAKEEEVDIFDEASGMGIN